MKSIEAGEKYYQALLERREEIRKQQEKSIKGIWDKFWKGLRGE